MVKNKVTHAKKKNLREKGEKLGNSHKSRNFPSRADVCMCHSEYFITKGIECMLKMYSLLKQSIVNGVMDWIFTV